MSSFAHYTQRTHDIAALIRDELSGEPTIREALDIVMTKVSEQVPNVSLDDVRDGLLKLADNMTANPVTRADPEKAVREMDKNELANQLASVVQGTKWAAITDGDIQEWKKGR